MVELHLGKNFNTLGNDRTGVELKADVQKIILI